MFLLPKELENMLGTREEFEGNQKLDEDGDDLMEENNQLDLAESYKVDCDNEIGDDGFEL